MCGISGIWSLKTDELQEQDLHRFNDSMERRGPDGKGIQIFSNGLGLAHRRLSILDTSDSGAQPMSHPSGRFHMTYNGEVFNFLELRKELETKGISFQSESDTEVIIAAYAEWGLEAFHRFNGMWAIAIWDAEEQELILCRDRFGIKPLYYLDSQEQFAFSSETNAFRNLNGFKRNVHPQRMQIGLEDTYALEGRGYTIYEDIYQLLPGHYMKLKRGDRPQQKRWYDIRDSQMTVPEDYSAQVAEYRSLFQESCALRMRSDVPLATALSGGVDSTAVYSMVHHLMKGTDPERVPADWQQAFVAVFPGTVQDETAYAEAAVAHTGGRATYLDPAQSDLLDSLISTTQHFDAISTTPILALMTVYQGMRKNGITVSLDGHGVDEMLYGYRKMVYDALEYHKWHGDRFDASNTAEVLLSLYAPEQRSAKASQIEKGIQQAFQMRSGLLSGIKRLIKKARPRPAELGASDLLPSLSDKPYDFSGMNAFDRMVYEEFFLDTLPSLLRNFDKAAMMHSIEIRMPFMDYRMVEYAFALPFHAKLGGGYTKRILRDAMEGVMPEANRVRTFKVGLAAPTMDWFKGPLQEWVSDMVHSQRFQQNPYLDAKLAQDLVQRSEQNDWTVPQASEAWKYLNAQLLMDV